MHGVRKSLFYCIPQPRSQDDRQRTSSRIRLYQWRMSPYLHYSDTPNMLPCPMIMWNILSNYTCTSRFIVLWLWLLFYCFLFFLFFGITKGIFWHMIDNVADRVLPNVWRVCHISLIAFKLKLLFVYESYTFLFVWLFYQVTFSLAKEKVMRCCSHQVLLSV